MPTYEFRAADGTVVEQFHHMSSVPDQIELGGKTYKRIPSAGMISAGVKAIVHGYPYVSLDAPLHSPGAGAYTPDGKCIITSRSNEREFCAMNNRVRV